MSINPNVVWLLKALNKIYPPVPLDEDTLTIWNMVLGELTRPEFEMALATYLRSNSAFFPRPGQLFQLVRPDEDSQQEAQLMADKIWNTMCSKGDDKQAIEEAKQKLGEIGWAYVESCGGWYGLKKRFQFVTGDPSSSIAQIRNSVQGILKRKKTGQILLPGGAGDVMKALGFEMKSIPKISGEDDLDIANEEY